MPDNQFVVDLGTLKLTDAQKNSINAAIQRAVAGELAGIGTANDLVLIPFRPGKSPFPGGTQGIIIRRVKSQLMNQLIS